MQLPVRLQRLIPRLFLYWFSCWLLRCCGQCEGTILDGPNNLTVDPDDWASFNCTVPCSNSINAWYVEGYPHPIEDPEYDSIPGMDVQRRVIIDCEDDRHTESLDILASEALNGAAVQCSNINYMCDPDNGECSSLLFYSRFAILSVAPKQTPPSPSPSSAPTPSPVPTPTSCTALGDQTTIISVTTTIVTVTVTETETSTIIITPTVLPTDLPTIADPETTTSAVSSIVNFGVSISFLTGLLLVAGAVVLAL